MVASLEVPAITHHQLSLAHQLGWGLECYTFLYFGRGVGRWVAERLAAYQRIAQELPLVRNWLDVEKDKGFPGVSVSQVVGEIATVVGWCVEFRVDTGIYTNGNAWRELTGNTERFSHLRLWDANYNGVAELEPVDYGGWKESYMKQYAGSVRLREGLEVDLNVRRLPDLTHIIKTHMAVGQ